MNVLLLCSRFPWPSHSGDRARAAIWLAALERVADVWLIAPRGEVPSNAPRMHFIEAKKSAAHAARAALRVMGDAPIQTLLAAPYDWRDAIARAQRDAGTFAATVVLLSRLDPWVRAQLPDGLHVLDAIDSLQRSMNERANEASPLLRWFWRAEARRIARVEAEAARVYDRVVVVSEDESEELGAIAIASGVPIDPLPDSFDDMPRAFDFGFWGRWPYFANADAASWLLNEIWPALRARLPHATLIIGGAEATANIRAAHGRDGIAVESPVADIAQFARQIRVALFPIRFGTGQSTKVLEAAEAGCAIVATPKAMRGFDALAAHAMIANDAASFADRATQLLQDDARRSAMAKSLRAVVETKFARETTLRALGAIVQRAEAAA